MAAKWWTLNIMLPVTMQVTTTQNKSELILLTSGSHDCSLLPRLTSSTGKASYDMEGSLKVAFIFIQYMHSLEVLVLWCLYWLGLGILSSVGLGTGLHTFLLYLGPFIASVTLAAFTCNSLHFPSPPYPTE